ncbi:MAG: hypothetical protein R3190_11320 [Thermoanaerobaculia bacterium]|nr:hypothetical protein [Thermoanaerobaculia bacterium]
MSRNAKVAIFTLALAVVAVPALANSFEVRLHNGTVFETRYEPEPAPWDDSLVYFMTDTSNTMAIPAADVAEIVSTVEDSGMGTFLDDHTILIGLAPNDNLTPEELEALGDQAPQPQLPNYNVQQFAEPNATQGIPIWFTNQTTPPLGGGGAFGGAAAERRGGGGGNFVEPNATNF